ncbi:MAG: hypothetical protein M5U32_18310 [Myxococcota bacterium]|nr:hypothetical protein [Myxococcota bacterium]
MARRKITRCGKFRCEKPAEAGGLCGEHLEEDRIQQARRERALQALHRWPEVENPCPEAKEFLSEFRELQKRWHLVCDVQIEQRSREYLPLEEARYASDWCISLGADLLEAIDAVQSGKRPSSGLEYTRGWVNERFANLERGLMSNGVPRPTAGADSR